MARYGVFKNKAEAIYSEGVISKNCGWPNKQAEKWADIVEINGKFGFILPKDNGSHGFKYDQMMRGVSEYECIEYVAIDKDDI